MYLPLIPHESTSHSKGYEHALRIGREEGCLPVSRYAKASSNALGLVLRCRDTFSSELVAEGTEAENEITEV